MSWCIVLPSLSGIWIRFLLANSFAFLIASGTCLALAWAIPILPAWFPTTTKAEKPNLLPPFTTLVIRLMWTSFSKISSDFLSNFFSIFKPPFHFFLMFQQKLLFFHDIYIYLCQNIFLLSFSLELFLLIFQQQF